MLRLLSGSTRWRWGFVVVVLFITAMGGINLFTKNGWMDDELKNELQDTLIVFNFSQKTQGRRMYIIDGLGHKKYEFPSPKDNKIYGNTPSISSNNIVAYTLIDYEKQTAEIYIYNYNTQENMMISNKTFDSKIQGYKYDTTHIDDVIGYFNWSPDGTKLAFFNEKDFVIYDFINFRDIIRIPTINSSRLGDRTYWLSNNEVALLSSGMGTKRKIDLGLIDGSTFEKNQDLVSRIVLSDQKTEVVNQFVCEGFIQPVFHEGVFYYKDKQINEIIPCIKTLELQSIFGSEEWPITWLYQSSNSSGRFYFYLRYKEIFEGISKKWIEGYDKVTGNTFFVNKLSGYLDEL
ncbi:MAG TPA: hypothetical protein VJB82_02455 [Candidatus Peribacterales bacterium]|nr:hypothetical protein [Candidatus Peribacterales bacterium]